MKRCGKMIFCVSHLALHKYIIWITLLFALGLAGYAQDQSFLINDSVARFKNKAAPAEVIRHINLNAVNFRKVTNKRLNFGITGNQFYYILLKLSAKNTLTGRYICLDNTSLDTVKIYRIYNNGSSRLIYQGGELVAYNTKRNYVWHTAPVQITTEPSIYLIALKAVEKNINVRYELLEANALQQSYAGYERLVFFYIGVVFVITAIIALSFFLFKKRVFVVYLAYILCISVWILSHYDRLFPFIYPNIPVLNEITKPVSSLGVCVFLLIVLNMVFKQQLQSRRWLGQSLKKMLYVLIPLLFLMFLLLIPNLDLHLKFSLMIAWHAGLVLSAPLIICTPLYFYRLHLAARIFSLAMLIICLTGVVQLFGNLGFINDYLINEHGMTIGSMLEMSIMAFGLFYSLLEDRKQKELQVQVLQDEQTEMLKKLITVQDNERKRIAADLHDNIGPLLAALKINFGRMVHAKERGPLNGIVAKTEAIIDDSLAEIRNVAHNLMPKSLSSRGLINTLAEYFEDIGRLHNKTIVFNHNVQSILNPELQLNVYRIICELVLNALKHSRARLITINIFADAKEITISINDDGQGFTPGHIAQKPSLGLLNTQSRISYMKGVFTLKTNPGEGTAINIQLPL